MLHTIGKLFEALSIRKHLELAFIVWNLNYYLHVNRIKSIQKKKIFLFALHKDYDRFIDYVL